MTCWLPTQKRNKRVSSKTARQAVPQRSLSTLKGLVLLHTPSYFSCPLAKPWFAVTRFPLVPQTLSERPFSSQNPIYDSHVVDAFQCSCPPALRQNLLMRNWHFFFFCLQFHSIPTSFYLCGWTPAITIVSLLSRSWAVCLAQKTLLCLLSEPSIFSSGVEMLSFVLGSLSRVQILSDWLSRFCFCRLQNPMTQERII